MSAKRQMPADIVHRLRAYVRDVDNAILDDAIAEIVKLRHEKLRHKQKIKFQRKAYRELQSAHDMNFKIIENQGFRMDALKEKSS